MGLAMLNPSYDFWLRFLAEVSGRTSSAFACPLPNPPPQAGEGRVGGDNMMWARTIRTAVDLSAIAQDPGGSCVRHRPALKLGPPLREDPSDPSADERKTQGPSGPVLADGAHANCRHARESGHPGAASTSYAALDPRFPEGDGKEGWAPYVWFIPLVEVVYPGSVASGDLGLLLLSAARQDLLNDLVAPGEGGLDMGIV